MTLGIFIPHPSLLAGCCFRSESDFSVFLSPLKCTPWPVIRNVRYNSLEQYHSILIRFQGLFTPYYGFFSAFHHSTVFAIGLETYLRLEVDASQIPCQYPMAGTQDTCTSAKKILRDCHPLRFLIPEKFVLPWLGLKASLITPHLPALSCRHSVCLLPCSLSDNSGISIDFFSSGY